MHTSVHFKSSFFVVVFFVFVFLKKGNKRTHQRAEPLRRVPTRDPGRVHLDPHVVFHGRGLRLARVLLPHRALIRAHQGLAQIVLAQGGGQAAQQQQKHGLEEHGRLGGCLERGPAQGEGATELRGEVRRMER